jgi:ornithine cyclodeaminase/alanine dehydrogenase-like protein (mu-crystallin family)
VEVLFLNQAEVRQLLDLNTLLDALAEEFKVLARGEYSVAPRNQTSVTGKGYLLGMPAWRPGAPVGVKLVSVFHGNDDLDIPSHQALISLFDAATGSTIAIMDGTYITAVRTSGTAALSARLLARQNSRVLTILGAGAQGQASVRLFPLVRDFDEIRIGSLYSEDARRLAAQSPKARAVESAQEAVRGADVIVLATTSDQPVIRQEWVTPGMHITSVGYMAGKFGATPTGFIGGELDPAIIRNSRLFVETREAFKAPPVGCPELQGMDPMHGTELGEVLLGWQPGRQSEEDITVYKAMGIAIEDLAAANVVYNRAQQEGVGRMLSL